MDREQAIEEFLTNLKRTFNIASLFPPQHPSYARAIEEFKRTIDPLFSVVNPIRLGVSPEYFTVDKKRVSSKTSYADTANMFHLRRIENIEIRQGVNTEELVAFFSSVSRSLREIMSAGGLEHVFLQDKSAHIAIEYLDYSELLRGSGSECKDIWVYLLQEAVSERDMSKIAALADNFAKMLQQFHAADLFEKKEARENICQFLAYLKGKDWDRFVRCRREVVISLLREKEIPSPDGQSELSVFVDNLTETEVGDILSQGLLSDEGFDPVAFAFLFRGLSQEQHRSVASGAARSLESRPFTEARKIKKNIEQLFPLSTGAGIGGIYRSALSFLLRDAAGADQKRVFDHEGLQHNFRFLLLNLLAQESEPVRLATIAGRIVPLLDGVVERKDAAYLVFLHQAMAGKEKAAGPAGEAFDALYERIYLFAERAALREELPAQASGLIDAMPESRLGIDYYLRCIFEEGAISPMVFKLLLRFFADELPRFYARLEEKSQDTDFLERLLREIGGIEAHFAQAILRRVYAGANIFFRIEVLRAMRELAECDTPFLLPIIETGSFALKKEALAALVHDPAARAAAADKLFGCANPWGFKNALLLDNIELAEEAGLQEARQYLTALRRAYLPWHWPVKREAGRLLKKWAK